MKKDCNNCKKEFEVAKVMFTRKKFCTRKCKWAFNSKIRVANGVRLRYRGYPEMFAKQNGCCAICGRHRSEFKTSFFVDHDHKCCPAKSRCDECVRGLLCRECNFGLGFFEDNQERLKAAYVYLSRVPTTKTNK